MAQFLSPINQFLSPYYDQMSLMLIATLLVIYGDLINKHIKQFIKGYHFLLRSLLFVVLCAFGYGALTLWAAPLFKHIIFYLPYHYRGVAFIGAFLVMGLLAERRRYI
ncbi:DUF3392 family protein [Alteromonas sp. C1M14]|uniref:DUF3392 family protein n=1 Tax=Alteromonas sp. C1M14 TaxID=2841567 RepID=UPI001C08BCAD|nr:DUF3392 family protein [Alteromonas sp. C1M14]MBU2978914.1 DUF3392 domain-containing protein [Alteromonas sp. C1M14]